MEKRIDRLHRLAAARPAVIGLGGGLPSERFFPRARLARAFVRAMREPAASALQYAWPEGREKLRQWVAARLRARGAQVGADDVIITSGAQQALAIAVQLICARGDVMGVDAETYPAALDLFRSRGCAVRVGFAGVRCSYVMPAIGNPHGRPMHAETRAALLKECPAIIEDDAYADLRFDGRMGTQPLLAAGRDRVWNVGSFSKTLCPGLRVGWLVPPPAWHARALELKHAADLQSSSLGQTVLGLFLEEDDFAARLARAQRYYGQQAERLLRAIRRWLPDWRCAPAEGGFALFAEADEPGDELALLEVATAHGVSFDPGRMFRVQPRAGAVALRLCFSFVKPNELDEGVQRMARAWDFYRAARDHAAVGGEVVSVTGD